MVAARTAVDCAKVALGERGPIWWDDDGAPDFNRRMARNTPYADWYASVDQQVRKDATSPRNSRNAESL